MSVTEFLQNPPHTGFSFEILPPLRGSSIERTFATIDMLREFEPAYVNITSHRSELVYKDTPDGLFRRVSERVRPGTVAYKTAMVSQPYPTLYVVDSQPPRPSMPL